ncbi:Imm32 family immunity protein [Saprospira grandis]|uniref:Imm32 family immunity protein n=1 Tax=Saprospira grandis TaxID=1008 RepID=UPI0022DD61EA|nr:hypothetical protein [Saprospira grandis]WBM76129.1 hypothetical protein OP864_07825 [Saprospira grandis]
MKLEIEIPDYNKNVGIKYSWEDSFDIKVTVVNGEVQIAANPAGLRSLANHLLNLSQDSIPSGRHLHFDEYNSLEDGSNSLTITKCD